MEHFVRMGWLLTQYGGCLTENQRDLMNLHFGQDLSLSEIAQDRGISRQGVADTLRRAELTLEKLETQLGLAARARQIEQLAQTALDKLGDVPGSPQKDAAAGAMRAIVAIVAE